MMFVDFGNSEKVPLSNIRGLQTKNPILAKVPHQVILSTNLHVLLSFILGLSNSLFFKYILFFVVVYFTIFDQTQFPF